MTNINGAEFKRWMVTVPLGPSDSALLKTLAEREQRPVAQYMRVLLRQAAIEAKLLAPVQAQEAAEIGCV